MPAEGIHITGFREASSRLPPDARRAVLRYEDAGRLGAICPDLPYFDRYVEEVIRYASGLAPRASPWGSVVHDGAAVEIVYALVSTAIETRSVEVAVLAVGAGSHAALDRALHPLINALARRHAEGRTHDAAHREVEKFQSICFHEAYFGTDRMGTDGIERLVRVPCGELFANPIVAAALAGAYAVAIAAGPSKKDLVRMGRGYEIHGRLLGSPLGARIASELEKAAAHPKFLRGEWGDFAAVFESGIAASIRVLEAIWAACISEDSGVAARMADVRAVLPRGTIDDLGFDVDLDAPYSARA